MSQSLDPHDKDFNASPDTDEDNITLSESFETAHDDAQRVNDRRIQAIRDTLEEENFRSTAILLEELGDADIAELLTKVTNDERHLLITYYAKDFPPQTYLFLDSELQSEIMTKIGAKAAANVVAELDSDDGLDLLEDLDPVYQKDIIRKLSAKDRAAMEDALNYEEDTAGRLMQREFVAVPKFWTSGKTIDYLRAEDGESFPAEFSDIFIIDAKYHVVGLIPLHKLVCSQRSDKIADIIEEDIIKIPVDMDQEEAARLFRRHGISTAPVIDNDNRMLGVLTLDDVADIIDEEATEDILRLGGVTGELSLTKDIRETARSRFTWLLVNLGTAILASYVVGMFEKEIAQIVALAVLMPIVANMGGNAGTQTLTITVRALATRELSRANAYRMIKKEVGVGLINGLIFAVLVGGMVMLRFHDPLLSAVMGSAMIINLLAAGLCGITIPLILDRLKLDPALSAGVWLTTVTDIVGFFAFLGLASWVLL